MQIKPEKLTRKGFKPYGKLLKPASGQEPDNSEPGVFSFYVTFANHSDGWRIGYLNWSGEETERLEKHPGTPEVFSPISGESILIVSNDPDDRDDIRAFYLDGPVVVGRGVWHNVITPAGESKILIVENPEVEGLFYDLPEPLTVSG